MKKLRREEKWALAASVHGAPAATGDVARGMDVGGGERGVASAGAALAAEELDELWPRASVGTEAVTGEGGEREGIEGKAEAPQHHSCAFFKEIIER